MLRNERSDAPPSIPSKTRNVATPDSNFFPIVIDHTVDGFALVGSSVVIEK
jgi:hypothetical protein